MKFTKAERKKSKLRLALTGPSGSGKTRGALLIAKGLGGRIAVIDTEQGSASLYCDLCDFDTLELGAPYSPERYREAIAAADNAGYDVLIIDSASHEWNGIGGCLEINEQLAQAKFRGNTWSAWNETTPRHRKFIDAMLQSRMHIICTGRSKTETAQTNDGGRTKIVKLGMKTEQREGFEYDFTVVLDLTHDQHFANPSKDRTGLFSGDPEQITEATGKRLLAWLESGAEETKEVDKDYEAICGVLTDSIQAIKDGIAENNLYSAAEAWFELSNDEKSALWRAPTKGGVFSTEERKVIASTEFREAYYGKPEAVKEAN